MIGSEKPPPELKNRALSPKQRRQRKTALGAAGEERAVSFLVDAGYHIRQTNLCYRRAEVDIVASDPATGELVFVEVKTRATDQYGHPSRAVTKKKVRSLQTVARAYLRQLAAKGQRQLDYRFDTIAVLPESIEHFKNITWGMLVE